MSVDHIIALLDVILNTTYFSFNGELYRQKFGAAMGSPISPIVANLFMEDFEKRALASAPIPPKRWDRYVDETFTIIQKIHVDVFTDHINDHFEVNI